MPKLILAQLLDKLPALIANKIFIKKVAEKLTFGWFMELLIFIVIHKSYVFR